MRRRSPLIEYDLAGQLAKYGHTLHSLSRALSGEVSPASLCQWRAKGRVPWRLVEDIEQALKLLPDRPVRPRKWSPYPLYSERRLAKVSRRRLALKLHVHDITISTWEHRGEVPTGRLATIRKFLEANAKMNLTLSLLKSK